MSVRGSTGVGGLQGPLDGPEPAAPDEFAPAQPERSREAAESKAGTATPAGRPTVSTGGSSAATLRPNVPPPVTGPLPDVLLQTDAATVIHGTDPGDFYCEHLFYLSQQAASAKRSSVVENAAGEPLVGFLHLPGDPYTEGGTAPYTQESRHAQTRDVVGAALRGYYADIAPQVHRDPIRMLVTGYGAFGSAKNNPTGDFVSHRENLDAAMRAAFGKDLLTCEGAKVGDGTYAYSVRDPESGRRRTVQIKAQQFDVADSTLDPANPRSIQRAIGGFRPHATLSMGVAQGSREYKAEHHADSGGLRKEGKRFVHDWGAAPEHSMPANYALARAIYRGGGGAAADLNPGGGD